MQRHHNFLIAAALAVALGGCAVLVQYGPADADALRALQSLTALDTTFSAGD